MAQDPNATSTSAPSLPRADDMEWSRRWREDQEAAADSSPEAWLDRSPVIGGGIRILDVIEAHVTSQTAQEVLAGTTYALLGGYVQLHDLAKGAQAAWQDMTGKGF
jgi:hypothetical protein